MSLGGSGVSIGGVRILRALLFLIFSGQTLKNSAAKPRFCHLLKTQTIWTT